MIRVFESNQKTLYAADDRKKQEEDKFLIRQENDEERKKWDLVWEKDRLLKEEKSVSSLMEMSISTLLLSIKIQAAFSLSSSSF